MEHASLDDPAELRAADPSGMLGIIGGLGGQLRVGFGLGRLTPELPSAEGLHSIVVCGMGGSGLSGDVLRSLFSDRLPLPIVASKGFTLPEFSLRDTLVVAISFSGDTEETLAAYAKAVAAGSRIVAISAGGELAVAAAADGVAHVRVPGDVAMPRAALGYLAGASMGVLDAMGLLPPIADDLDRAQHELDRLAAELGPGIPAARNRAKDLASWLMGRTPVVWSSEGLAQAAGERWKSQFAENAKVPAFHGTIPELCHNEVEGWSEGSGRSFGLVVLRHRMEHPRIEERIHVSLEAIAASGLESREAHAVGTTAVESLFSLIMLGDFVATYLGILRGVDPTPIPVLTSLKERLHG